MVLIFSRNNEKTTDLVIDWLIKYKIPYNRINSEYYFNVNWDFQDNHNKIAGVNIKDIKVVWFRKYSVPPLLRVPETVLKEFNFETFNFLEREIKSYHDFIVDRLLSNKKMMGS